MKRLLSLSIALNFLLLIIGSSFAYKRWRFRYDLIHRKGFVRYEKNAQYVEQTNLQSGYKAEKKIIMLGDSHVYKEHWNDLLDRGDIGNRGIGSDITEGYLHRLTYVFAAHPSIVFLEGGINDIWYGISEDSIMVHLRELTDTFQHAGIIVVLQTVAPLARSEARSSSINRKIIPLNNRIRKLAQCRHAPLIDLYALLQQNGRLPDSLSQPDGMHFRAAAYNRWKKEINRVLAVEHLDKPDT